MMLSSKTRKTMSRAVSRVLLSTLVVIIAISFMPVNTFAAAKKVTSTCYEVQKEKNALYVNATCGIYKITLKNGKPKKSKRLVKITNKVSYYNMIKKGKYIYFVRSYVNKEYNDICRIKTSGGKVKRLARVKFEQDPNDNYYEDVVMAIKGKKIYYTLKQLDSSKKIPMVMNLNGKNKKKTTVQAKLKHKKTNKKGYTVQYKWNSKYTKAKVYVKTPKGKKKIATTSYVK